MLKDAFHQSGLKEMFIKPVLVIKLFIPQKTQVVLLQNTQRFYHLLLMRHD